jgi:hypothetical protein
MEDEMMQKIMCWFGFHDYEIVEAKGVYDFKAKCKVCAKIIQDGDV